jgi:hypothetical protein
MKLKKNFEKPLLMLSIGIVILGSSLIIGYWYKWEPISFKIDLQAGTISRSPPFDTDLTADYLIELEAERNLPFEQLNCLLGISESIGLEKCHATQSPIDLRWSVFSSSGKQIAQGESNQEKNGVWGPTVSRIIGRFRGEKGNKYLLQVESLKDATMLAPTNPRITVRTHSLESKGHYIVSGIGTAFGAAIAVMGLIWLAVRIISSRTRG